MEKLNAMLTLRRETADLHRQVEQRVAMEKMNHLPHYKTLLCAFFGFYSGIETLLLEQATPALPDAHERHKVAWLQKDLVALGMSSESIQSLPQCSPWSLPSIFDALGALYVLEGATLGGGYIAASIQKTLAIGPENGGRFFMNYGDRRKAMWTEFGERLNAATNSDADEAAVIRGAKDTFVQFDHWLERYA